MMKLGLERMSKVLEHLANPHAKIPIVHVAGTNGKGSVCAYAAEILKRSGMRVGRFTSPYLLEPADSITMDGHQIDRQTYQETEQKIRLLLQRSNLALTPFETLTAIAFEVFSRDALELDLAVVEVGLGGKGDSTNVCGSNNTLLSCITPISIDHQSFLGDTIDQIASHKAGIMKPRVPVLVAQQNFSEQVNRVVNKEAEEKMCQVFWARPYPPSLGLAVPPPLPITPMEKYSPTPTQTTDPSIPNVLVPASAAFQHQNAVTAATLAHLLRTHPHPLGILPSLSHRITDQAIVEGLKETRWRGRLDLISYQSRQILLDGAHNRASAQVLGDHITSMNRPTTLILSLSFPRDPQDFIDALGLSRLHHPVQIIVTPFSVPTLMQWVKPVSPLLIARSFTSNQALLNLPIRQEDVHVSTCPQDALQLALSLARGLDELIVVSGSLYLISDVLKIIDLHQGNMIH